MTLVMLCCAPAMNTCLCSPAHKAMAQGIDTEAKVHLWRSSTHSCRRVTEGEHAGKLESEDAFLKHTKGLLRFYGAVLQYHDPGQAWHYVACFANTQPPNAFTSTAIVAFLETAGFALSQRFRHQFSKLLRVRACCALAH